MQIVIIGGVGGIGAAIIKQLLTHYPNAHITATYYRHPPTYQHSQVHWFQLNIHDEKAIQRLSRTFTKVDLLINAVGILHTAEQLPEKSITEFDPTFFQLNITTNTLPSLFLAKHFMPRLKMSAHSFFITISARIGSIEDNQLGGWISYRSSKAALNMAMKTISIEWRYKLPRCCVFVFHPGTTETALSQPFQHNIPQHRLFTPDYTAQCLLSLITTLTPQESGQFLSYNGEQIPW